MTIYPELSRVPWYLAELKEGDCLYIPFMWIHNVHMITSPKTTSSKDFVYIHLPSPQGKGKDTVLLMILSLYITHFEGKGYHSGRMLEHTHCGQEM